MKRALLLCSLVLALRGPAAAAPDTAAGTGNSLYGSSETVRLTLGRIELAGEIESPGMADLAGLQRRAVVAKEAVRGADGSEEFAGAFRYEGFSLHDILERHALKKANAAAFPPAVDAFVEVEGAGGEKAVFSWGEIYYTADPHRVIIADSVSRIVPAKTGELWRLPAAGKVVAADDLYAERNIASPVRITVRSFPGAFDIRKGLSPMYSPEVKLQLPDGGSALLRRGAEFSTVTVSAVFYGRGLGLHGIGAVSGGTLGAELLKYYPYTPELARHGLLCFVGLDGYHAAVSYAELFNRGDGRAFLLRRTGAGEDGGYFRLYPAADFFSDREVRALSEIRFLK